MKITRYQFILLALARRGLFFVFGLLLLTTQGVSAYSAAQRNVFSEGVYQFDTESDQCTSGGSSQTTSVAMPANATLDDKIAQTFLVGFDAGTPQATITKVVTDTHIGGIYFTGTTDAKAQGLTKDYFGSLGKAAGVPLMIASDEEGGVVHRFAYGSSFPSAKAMGTMSDSQVEDVAKQAAQTMAADGVTVDLAPVLDIDNGKNDGAISANNRAFSANPTTITAKAGAFAKGLQESGITPVFKHFPGLGQALPDSNTDAHKATSPALSELKAADLVPYSKLVGQYGAPVMLSNEYVTGVDAHNPASESADVVNLLRKTYNFNGLIMTDDLKPASGYDGLGSLPNSIAKAEAAGVNMPLFSYTSEADITAAIAAVKAQASTAQINTSVGKVIAAKGGGDANSTLPATNDGSSSGCCSGATTNVAGSDHVPAALNFMQTQLGVSFTAAVGIIANLQRESGATLDTTATDGVAHGIAQWQNGRWANLQKFADNDPQHRPWSDFTLQLDFLKQEATHNFPGLIDQLKAAADAKAAAEVWLRVFEGASDPNATSKNNTNVDTLLTKYNSASSTVTASTTSAGGCQSNAGFAGDAGKYAKVISCPSDPSIICTKTIYYSQYEGPWANETFSSCGTVGACGCGLTSAAMALATLANDPSITPQSLLPAWQANGLATAGGTGWSVAGWKAVGTKYGVKVAQLSAHQNTGMSDSEIQAIVDAVTHGALVGVSGQGSAPPFTTGGHFILIRGYDPAKKQFLINDPNNTLSNLTTTSKTWGWDMLRTEGQSAWTFTK